VDSSSLGFLILPTFRANPELYSIKVTMNDKIFAMISQIQRLPLHENVFLFVENRLGKR
jgi:hypothetical protein